MDLREPIRKRNPNHLTAKPPLPIITSDNSGILVDNSVWVVYTGHYNGQTVIIDDEEMNALHSMGFFGKGSLSRSYPQFGKVEQGVPPLIKERQWQQRLGWLSQIEDEVVESGKVKEQISSKINQDSKGSSLIVSSPNHSDNTHCANEDIPIEERSQLDQTSSEGNENNTTEVCNQSDDKKNKPQALSGEEKAKDCQDISEVGKKKTLNNQSEEEIKETDAENLSGKSQVEESVDVITASDEETNSKRKRQLKSDESEEESIQKKICIDEAETSTGENVSSADSETAVPKGETDEKSIVAEESTYTDQMLLEEKCNKSIQLTLATSDHCRNLEVLVAADSDSENEEQVENLRPHIEVEQIQTVFEELHLTIEEAFFLSFALGCLEVIDISGKFLSINSMWNIYRTNHPYFIQKYVTYHHFRSKGWVVKPGLKFGGDFVLYKKGPPFYHASYVVLIEVFDSDGKQWPEMCTRNLTWRHLGGLNRLAESTNKELLLCQIQWPKLTEIEIKDPMCLKKFKVGEMLLRRWQATQEREL